MVRSKTRCAARMELFHVQPLHTIPELDIVNVCSVLYSNGILSEATQIVFPNATCSFYSSLQPTYEADHNFSLPGQCPIHIISHVNTLSQHALHHLLRVRAVTWKQRLSTANFSEG